MIKLLYTVNSPYARKVRLVAYEKNIELSLVEVELSDPNCPVNQYNPLGKVPVLVLENGEAIYDSTVIVEFLDGLSAITPLIPSDFANKIQVRRWEALADGVSDALIAVMLEKRKPDEAQSSRHIDRQMGKVLASLTVLNKDMYKKKWCVNETFSLADIALGCMLGYADLRHENLHEKNVRWQEQFPNLAKYYAVLVKRPNFKRTMPKL